MKTAIEQLVDFLELEHSDILYQYPILLSNIDKHLETEKQQIIEAVTYGNRMEFYDATETAGEQYYETTFEN